MCGKSGHYAKQALVIVATLSLLTERKTVMVSRFKQAAAGLLWMIITLTLCACGQRTAPETVSDFADDGPVPVAKIHDMRLPIPFWKIPAYTFNDQWFYCVGRRYDRELQAVCGNLYRCDPFAEFELNLYVENLTAIPQMLLADRENNCVLFGKEGDDSFFLEKYDGDGVLQWHVTHPSSELLDKGENIQNGVIAGDGRIYLFVYGAEGRVFVFGQDGSLLESYVPELEELQGLAEGRDNRVYGYCLTGEEPVFTSVEEGGKYVCPMVPLQAYGGGEDGIYLCVGDGLWKYDPDTGETERMWYWDDEYIQIDGMRVQQIFRGKENIQVLCQERHPAEYVYAKGEILTFAAVSYKDRREYPPKQEVTLGRAYNSFSDLDYSRMDDLVRRYNRQSGKYKVVILYPEEKIEGWQQSNELLKEIELQLLRGEGPDLIQIDGLDTKSMVSKGVFEDLEDYYKSSEKICWEDILEPVREACLVLGENVLVIPYFALESMLIKDEVEREDWTPWKFLEVTQRDGAVLHPEASQLEAFWYCMGVRLEGRFINYEKRECYFDTAEFQKVLEECSKWKGAEPPVVIAPQGETVTVVEPQDWLLSITYLSDTSLYIGRMRNANWLGMPGWEGAQNIIVPQETFAINSASRNKEGAWDFLEFVLSEELQDTIDQDFPVRTDSFDKYLAYSYANPEDSNDAFSYVVESRLVPTEEDFIAIRDMVSNAVSRDAMSWASMDNDPVRVILEEEVGMYFSGDATVEETVKKIQSRVTLYLNEL